MDTYLNGALKNGKPAVSFLEKILFLLESGATYRNWTKEEAFKEGEVRLSDYHPEVLVMLVNSGPFGAAAVLLTKPDLEHFVKEENSRPFAFFTLPFTSLLPAWEKEPALAAKIKTFPELFTDLRPRVQVKCNPYTVIALFPDSGQVVSHYTLAKDGYHAFWRVATQQLSNSSNVELVVAIPGFMGEVANDLSAIGVTYPGELTVDAQTIREQPEVFRQFDRDDLEKGDMVYCQPKDDGSSSFTQEFCGTFESIKGEGDAILYQIRDQEDNLWDVSPDEILDTLE